MVSQTGKKPPCGNTFAGRLPGRLPGRLHRKPGLSNRMPDPRKTIQSAARNFLGVRRACRNTRRCARKNTCRRALSERCTTQRRKNAVRCACPKRSPNAHREEQRAPSRKTCTTCAKTPPKVGTRPPEYTPVRTQKSSRRALSERCTTHAPQKRRPPRVSETPAGTPARHRDAPAETSARNTARRTCSGILHPASKHSAGLQSHITHKTSPSYIKKKGPRGAAPLLVSKMNVCPI